jgi:outer membrane lipoprotein SlyB
MRHLILIAAGAAALAGLGGCASTSDRYADGYGAGRDRYATACERDYEQNRNAATAAGAVLGGAAGAAIAKNDTAGVAIGAIAGGAIGRSLATKDDPCGYGFNGYYRDGDSRYGYWDERAGRWVRG